MISYSGLGHGVKCIKYFLYLFIVISMVCKINDQFITLIIYSINNLKFTFKICVSSGFWGGG